MKNSKVFMLLATAFVVSALIWVVFVMGSNWQISQEIQAAGTKALTAAESSQVEYREFPVIGSRVAVWVIAQLHLMFAAFVLAVPMFALIIETIGYFNGDPRYNKLAYEFTKLLSTSFSFTATLGALLTFMLFILYPRVMDYMVGIFSWTFFPYVLLFFLEAGFLYSYYYGWGKFNPKVHLALGLGLNVVGTAIMFIANAWLSFMNSPPPDLINAETGAFMGTTWDAINNFTWMPINIHRIIANVAFGGSIAAAYAAFKFIGAKTEEERAHYDWMGYIGNFVAISAFLTLPFAGYWLGKEIYAYNQSLGMVLMGGTFSWLFIIQAVLIGNLFLGANWYLWVSMERIDGGERYKGYIPYLLVLVALCFIVWATPHSLVATAEEAQQMGGSHHPVLGVLGVMSAKNTAVNILILTTFFSFLLYRRAGKGDPVPFSNHGPRGKTTVLTVAAIGAGLMLALYYPLLSAVGAAGIWTVPDFIKAGLIAMQGLAIFLGASMAMRDKPITGQWAIFGSTAFIVIFLGIYGYMVEASVRIGFSVYQVVSVLSAMISVIGIDVFLLRGAPTIGQINWGRIKPRSQYALFFLAITFTWLMGLMGYVRAGLRQLYHVFGVEAMVDTSPHAFIPTLGFAATVVSVTVLIFFSFIAVVFWLSGLSSKEDYADTEAGRDDLGKLVEEL